ncbi:MAG: fibronectin type III domain-containing protein [Actinomycetota bacterium]|nr:fibronectin type III domain-containing protein [Actinomycetota bacterium]
MRELRRALAPIAVLAFFAVAGAGAAAPAPPSVSTAAATATTSSGTTLNGTVNPNAEQTQYAFQYGPTVGYGHETPVTSAGAGTTPAALSATLGSLASGSTYHFRIIAVSSAGTSVGDDLTFATSGTAPGPSAPPSATTGPASGVGQARATLSGSVNPNGQAASHVFEYGPTTNLGFQTAPVNAGSGTAAVAARAVIADLQPGTTYHFRLVATGAGGTALGVQQTFTTTTPPAVSTGSATSVSSTAATVNATIDPLGLSTHYEFQFGPTPFYGLITPPGSIGSGVGAVAVHQTLTDLAPGTTYHYRIYAQSAGGTSLGIDRTFTTAGGPVVSSHVAVLGRMGYVSSRGGFVGVVLGCFGGQARCTGRFTIMRGRRILAQRNFSLATEGGGFQNVKLTRQGQPALFRSYHGPVAVRLNVLTSTGQRISRGLHLARWF